MLNNFTREQRDVNGVRINFRHGGKGPPLLLLHGYPQTHVIWHKVADALAERFTLVMPDLRGYGDSSKPKGDANMEIIPSARWRKTWPNSCKVWVMNAMRSAVMIVAVA